MDAPDVPPPLTETDAVLLGRIAAGDERALAALYDRWVLRVYSLAERLLGDADEAEDVVEETFWRAWRSSARYQSSRGAVGVWLLSISRRRALDRLRMRRRRVGLLERVAQASATPESVPTPLNDAEAAERRSVVLDALEELPEEQRRAIELAYFGGMSQREIARHTGQPLGTVKTRIRLGMQKLRARLYSRREDTPPRS